MTIAGLPTAAAWTRWAPRIVGVLAVATMLAGLWVRDRNADQRGARRSRRARRKRKLLDELVAARATGGDTAAPRAIRPQLEDLWDESGVDGRHKVGKRYGTERALANVTLELRAGSMCAVLGHNGAGKTTLLGILSTLVAPDAGTVTYRRASASSRARGVRREIGISRTRRCVTASCPRREPRAGRRALRRRPRAPRCAARSRRPRQARARRAARTYSRGMLQRLALARALLTKPSLVLLDEPFTGLDRDGALALGEQLGELKDAGAIVVVVTHDLEAIAGRTDHVAILRARPARVRRARRPTATSALKELYHRRSRADACCATLARIAWKDLRVELRSREIFVTMAFFGGLLVVIYSFAFPHEPAACAARSPGMLWVALAFTGTIAPRPRVRSRARERHDARAVARAGAAALGVPRQGDRDGGARARGRSWSCAAARAVPRRAAVRLSARARARGPARRRSASRSSARCSRRRCSRSARATCCYPVILYPLLVPLFVAGTKSTAGASGSSPNLEIAWYWIDVPRNLRRSRSWYCPCGCSSPW